MTAFEGSDLRLAQRIALMVPALLLAGAYVAQYVFDLYPCEMCLWQRWPHFAALAFAFVSFLAKPKKWLIALAAGGMLTSAAIGGFHAGVEYGWWEGLTSCTAIPQIGSGQNALDAIMAARIIRCDEAPWDLFGISLAGFNFLISGAAGAVIFSLLFKERRS